MTHVVPTRRSSVRLVVFSGPHGYVSPRWYETAPAVPTWNYEAVHVAGRAKAIHDPAALRSIVDRLSRVYETRSEEHTSELQSLMRISYAVFCLKNKNHITPHRLTHSPPSRT